MRTKDQLEQQKKELVEKFGAFMERKQKLTPIAARIFATLFICGQKGITFDELVQFLGASKSTISTNINKLSNSDIITYFTKPGERKKYFVLSPVAFLSRVEKEMILYKTEHQIVSEIIKYKEEANQWIENEEDKYVLRKPSPYLDFLSNTMELLEKLREHVQFNCGLPSPIKDDKVD